MHIQFSWLYPRVCSFSLRRRFGWPGQNTTFPCIYVTYLMTIINWNLLSRKYGWSGQIPCPYFTSFICWKLNSGQDAHLATFIHPCVPSLEGVNLSCQLLLFIDITLLRGGRTSLTQFGNTCQCHHCILYIQHTWSYNLWTKLNTSARLHSALQQIFC